MEAFYRFIYGGVPSRTGRFKTLPEATGAVPEDRVRFGYISCQDYTNGYYTALQYLAEEDVDFVVHLGDYIYETVDEASFQNGQVRQITLPNEGDPKEADTLNDYRFLYKTYKSDENLQKVHENFAFITSGTTTSSPTTATRPSHPMRRPGPRPYLSGARLPTGRGPSTRRLGKPDRPKSRSSTTPQRDHWTRSRSTAPSPSETSWSW